MKTVPLGTQVVVHGLAQLHVCSARLDVGALLLEPSTCVGAKRLILLWRSGRRSRVPITSVAFREAFMPPPVAAGFVSVLVVVVAEDERERRNSAQAAGGRHRFGMCLLRTVD
jgi:hypothetical protein